MKAITLKILLLLQLAYLIQTQKISINMENLPKPVLDAIQEKVKHIQMKHFDKTRQEQFKIHDAVQQAIAKAEKHRFKSDSYVRAYRETHSKNLPPNHKNENQYDLAKLLKNGGIIRDKSGKVYQVTAKPKMYADSIFDHIGVTIKPHSNIGVKHNAQGIPLQNAEASQIYTAAITSTAQAINRPGLEQFTEDDGLKSNNLYTKATGLETHASQIETTNAITENNDPLLYTKAIPSSTTNYITPQDYNQYYASNHAHDHPNAQQIIIKDHSQIPIVEEQSQEIERPLIYFKHADKQNDAIVNNYYKIEVASQTFKDVGQHYLKNYETQATTENNFNHRAPAQYILPTNHGVAKQNGGGDVNEDTDNVSIKLIKNKNRMKRDVHTLETGYFTKTTQEKIEEPVTETSNDTFHYEALKLPHYFIDKYVRNMYDAPRYGDSLVGEAYDFDYEDDARDIRTKRYHAFEDYEPIDYEEDEDSHSSYSIPSTSYIDKQLHKNHNLHGTLANLHTSYGEPPTVQTTAMPWEPVYILTESQIKDIMGHNNLNIGHLDVFHLNKGLKKPKRPVPHHHKPKGRPHKRYNPKYKIKYNLRKLNRFLE